MKTCRSALAGGVAGMLSAACTIDTGKSDYCDRQLEISGTVDGAEVADDGYSMQSIWFNKSLEEGAVNELDAALMKELGLDPEDPEDVARFRYFLSAYDHRVLLVEEKSTTDYGSLGGTTGKDFGTFFFDLEEHEAQPEEELAIFDASAIHIHRNDRDTDALGQALREILDEMKDNGHPDVLVAFAEDRSEESSTESSLIVLLSKNATYASGGTASFHSVVDLSGDDVSEIVYQTEDIDAMSMTASATFGNTEIVDVEATCLKVDVSGKAE